jgi:endoglucanase
VYSEVLRAAVRTFYLQRCGVAKEASHAGPWADEHACHLDDAKASPAPGQTVGGRRDLSGGWHDAGDYNKYVWYSVSNAILFMVEAWQQGRSLLPDGCLDIPESDNGVSDLLDEVRWETDFLLKMQLDDGSVLSRVQAAGSEDGRSPPSADAVRRVYYDPTEESAAVFAGSLATASRAFRVAGLQAYAATLGKAACAAWEWLRDRGRSAETAWAAAELFRSDPTIASARQYVDNFLPDWSDAELPAGAYETHAALAYLQAEGGTPAVVRGMRRSLSRAVDAVFSTDDLYGNGISERDYHWGSNGVRAATGVFLLRTASLGISGSRSIEDCRRHALDILHYFHGQNPAGMVFLTNMARRGGEHSSWQIYHHWFGQSGDPYSRSRYVGKPPAVDEPDYPYFRGIDNHGVRDDKASLFGPPPGFVPGGPNRDYSGDAIPPRGDRYPALFYRDWNDQGWWTARTWEITEPSIGYQGPYVALLAAFVEHAGGLRASPYGNEFR